MSAVWSLRFGHEANAAPSMLERLSALLGLGDEQLHDPAATSAVRVIETVFFENGRPT